MVIIFTYSYIHQVITNRYSKERKQKMTKMSEKHWFKKISVLLVAFAMLFTMVVPSSMDKVYAESGSNAPITVNLTIATKGSQR